MRRKPPYPYQPQAAVEPGRYSIPADVLFAFDSATLRPQASEALQRTLGQIRQAIRYPAIRVEGNTDSVGSDPYNDQLSLRRRKLWRNGWSGKAFPRRRSPNWATASARPVAPNTRPSGADDPAGRAQNRRVDLIASPA